ncbi:HTH-type transcriptional regulator DegA [Moorella thermoacetica]
MLNRERSRKGEAGSGNLVGNRMKARLTIKQIAKLANVSDSTVSRVLNNQPDVNEDTRQRVLAIVKELNYRPDPIARSLVTGQSQTLAFLTEDIRNPFFAEVARGLEDAASKYGYQVIYCSTDSESGKEKMYIEMLLAYRIAGIVFTSFSGNKEVIQEIIKCKIPYVFVNRFYNEIPGDCVLIDNYQGGYMATRHLIKLGHRRIVHLGRSGVSCTSLDRKRGYEQALREAGIEYNENLVKEIKGGLKYNSGYEITKAILQEEEFTAIFAVNDLIALGAWMACLEEGRRVPEDIAIVGFDNIDFTSFPTIGLTTIDQPKYEMGRQCMKILIDRLRGDVYGEKYNKKIVYTPKLVIRKSCGYYLKGYSL